MVSPQAGVVVTQVGVVSLEGVEGVSELGGGVCGMVQLTSQLPRDAGHLFLLARGESSQLGLEGGHFTLPPFLHLLHSSMERAQLCLGPAKLGLTLLTFFGKLCLSLTSLSPSLPLLLQCLVQCLHPLLHLLPDCLSLTGDLLEGSLVT